MKTKNICIALLISAGLLAAGCDKLGSSKKDESSADDSKKKDDSKKSDKKSDTKSSADAKADGTAAPSGAATAAPAPVAAGDAKAAAHLPSDCEIGVHFQVGKLISNAAFQKDVVPSLDEMLATEKPKDKDFADFQGFMKDAGLDWKKSIQDVAVCVTSLEKSPQWALAIGGDIKPDSILPALEKHQGKSKLEPIDVGGVKGLGDKKGSIVQLSDGTIVFSETKDFLAKLVPSGDGASKLKLDLGKELSFAVSEAGMKAAFATGKKAPDEFQAIQHVEGSIDLGSGKAVVRLATGSAEAAKKLDALLTLMKSQFEKQAAGNKFGEADALKGTTSKIEGNDVLIESAIPAGTLDKAAAALGEQLKKSKGKM